jgi:hypothetical protein
MNMKEPTISSHGRTYNSDGEVLADAALVVVVLVPMIKRFANDDTGPPCRSQVYITKQTYRSIERAPTEGGEEGCVIKVRNKVLFWLLARPTGRQVRALSQVSLVLPCLVLSPSHPASCTDAASFLLPSFLPPLCPSVFPVIARVRACWFVRCFACMYVYMYACLFLCFSMLPVWCRI